MDIKAQTYKLIDDLKAVCHNYGMGNDGNEYKVITQIFLYKFLNDKFGYEIKKRILVSPVLKSGKPHIPNCRRTTGLIFWIRYLLIFHGFIRSI